ncbi:hypothetical protein [Streptococcus sp. DD10]|uniref:hypothetical protein n=1 Tax=Streptococcus sp. DD10 TaxID=1777878 RepID=UPI0008309962|nr:hypothetical protein [Streptococcus sp. DD10]
MSLYGVCLALFAFVALIEQGSKIKKLTKRVRRLEKHEKGSSAMSRLLEELKGQKATVIINGFGMEWEILDVDEDWVKLTRTDKKGNVETQLKRVEDIQSVSLK